LLGRRDGFGWEKGKQKRGRGMIGKSQVEEVYPLGRAYRKKKGVPLKKTIKQVGKALVIWNLLHVRNEDQCSDPQSLVSSYCKEKKKN